MENAGPTFVDRGRCARCRTELAPHALACPACGTLVHAERLRELAATAGAAAKSGDLVQARDQWQDALRFLPSDSRQYATIRSRVSDLTRQIEAAASPGSRPKTKGDESWWKRGGAGIVTVGLLLIGKLKFLVLGLTKASTFLSMFAFFAVYWRLYGWPLAAGLVVSIYIHEMGHVAMLRRLGIAAGAPLFIPGVGALVMLKQHVTDPVTDAKIGLAGPVWGLGAALAALGVYAVTHAQVWLAIAHLTGFLNLFNLIPIWQLDGSRGFHALSRQERWMVVAALGGMLYVTGLKFLWIVGGVAVWRAMQREVGPGDRRIVATFVGLVIALAWIARGVA
ncbi:MAG TPA: site-2 protease family protein [Gemmatimonadaceae bacterium]|nr:site-2 protease family protein [Gemmatimonadaceae bacterium]